MIQRSFVPACLLLLGVLAVGCGDDGGGSGGSGAGGGGETATSSSSGTTTTSGVGGGGVGGGGGGGVGGGGGSGAGGPYASCAEAGATDCFSNYDCPDASTRCENVGTDVDLVPCCVPGARGDGALGAPCTSENDCASGLCVELDGGTSLCTEQCVDASTCITALPDCYPVAFSGSDDSFCLP